MKGGVSRAHLGYLIDRPSTKAPLEVWQKFLASMRSKPQENDVFREMTEHAAAVVDWKTNGEKGEAPQRMVPTVPQASKA